MDQDKPTDKPVDKPAGDKGPQPGVDADAIRAAVSDALKDWTPPEPQRQDDHPRPESREDPLATLIGSHVNPAFRQMGYEIADAKDAALYYIDHPEMIPHKAAIEDAFNRLKSQGTPMARVAVGDWYRGKNFDAFKKQADKDAQEAAERARAAADTGGGVGRERQPKVTDPHTQSDEDLAKSLEGVAF